MDSGVGPFVKHSMSFVVLSPIRDRADCFKLYFCTDLQTGTGMYVRDLV